MHESLSFYGLLTAVFIAAGLVKGVTGMGLPTIAMALLSLGMPPATAAGLLLVPSFVTNLWQLLAGPALLPLLRRLWLMMACILVSTVAASVWLLRAHPAGAGLALGLALILYAAYTLCAPALTLSPRSEKSLAPLVGLITGAITGATGVFVMPAVPYLQALGLDKDDLVQALGLSFTLSTLALAAGLLVHDALRLEQAGLSLLAILPALAGMWLGQKLRARISQKRFRQYFLCFLLLLGGELVWRAFR